MLWCLLCKMSWNQPRTRCAGHGRNQQYKFDTHIESDSPSEIWYENVWMSSVQWQIFVFVPNGRCYPAKVTAETSTRELKRLASDLSMLDDHNTLPDTVHVVFDGKYLFPSSKSIHDFGICNGSTIFVQMSRPGGARGCFSFFSIFRTTLQRAPSPDEQEDAAHAIAIEISNTLVRETMSRRFKFHPL